MRSGADPQRPCTAGDDLVAVIGYLWSDCSSWLVVSCPLRCSDGCARELWTDGRWRHCTADAVFAAARGGVYAVTTRLCYTLSTVDGRASRWGRRSSWQGLNWMEIVAAT